MVGFALCLQNWNIVLTNITYFIPMSYIKTFTYKKEQPIFRKKNTQRYILRVASYFIPQNIFWEMQRKVKMCKFFYRSEKETTDEFSFLFRIVLIGRIRRGKVVERRDFQQFLRLCRSKKFHRR